MSLSSPTFDFDKLEPGKPSKFVSNGLYLPKTDDADQKPTESQNTSTLTNKTNTMHLIQDLPIRAKAPIYSNIEELYYFSSNY